MITRTAGRAPLAVHSNAQPLTTSRRATTVGPLTDLSASRREGALDASLIPATGRGLKDFIPAGWQDRGIVTGGLMKSPYREVMAVTIAKGDARALLVLGKSREGMTRLGVAPHAVGGPGSGGATGSHTEVSFEGGKLFVETMGGSREQWSNTYAIDYAKPAAGGASHLQVESLAMSVQDTRAPGLPTNITRYNLLDGTVTKQLVTQTSNGRVTTDRHAFKAADFSAINADALAR